MQRFDTTPLTAKVRRSQVRAFWKGFRTVPGVRDPLHAARYFIVLLGVIVIPIGILAMAPGVGEEPEEHAPDMVGQLVWTAARMHARRSRREYFRLARFASVNGLT